VIQDICGKAATECRVPRGGSIWWWRADLCEWLSVYDTSVAYASRRRSPSVKRSICECLVTGLRALVIASWAFGFSKGRIQRESDGIFLNVFREALQLCYSSPSQPRYLNQSKSKLAANHCAMSYSSAVKNTFSNFNASTGTCHSYVLQVRTYIFGANIWNIPPLNNYIIDFGLNHGIE